MGVSGLPFLPDGKVLGKVSTSERLHLRLHLRSKLKKKNLSEFKWQNLKTEHFSTVSLALSPLQLLGLLYFHHFIYWRPFNTSIQITEVHITQCI